jgi:hypothetical protein
MAAAIEPADPQGSVGFEGLHVSALATTIFVWTTKAGTHIDKFALDLS